MIRLIREQVPQPEGGAGGRPIGQCSATGVVRSAGINFIRVEVDAPNLSNAPQGKCHRFEFEWDLDDMKIGDRVCARFDCRGFGFEPQVREVRRGPCDVEDCIVREEGSSQMLPLTVDRVIDGDTFDGIYEQASNTHQIRIRVAGINTPETDECGYDGATKAAKRLLGNQVWIDFGPYSITSHDRLVSEVFLDESGAQRFGQKMVNQGWAEAIDSSPVDPEEAMEKSGGVWDLCSPEQNPFIGEDPF